MNPVRNSRPLSRAAAAGAVALVPWAVVLSSRLPATTVAHHWSIAWGGFDLMIAASLAALAWTARRGDPRLPLAATATATLAFVDAWFDVLTAAPGPGRTAAVLLAVCAELPLALFCAWLARRTAPRYSLAA
ncbi:hypothetical protein [Actinocorallia longicatena]|uniref:LPXTG-motif cell wall-anchored protein n=1 Tax=Actinocorallia longicatena TaxID=111803 RepID=A0ABP6QCN6_9ACTN